MTLDELKALREMETRATPGPWSAHRWANGQLSTVVRPGITEIGYWEPRDAALIVAARNSLGPLLDELETLRRENYDLRDGQFVPALTASRDAARAEAAKLRAALECVATTEPDGLCWCVDADTRAAFGHAGWCKKARATLAETRPSSPPERPIPAADAPRVPSVLVDGIPRRNRVELRTRAETAITEAMWAVENAGADPLLTDATSLLYEAREKVADFVDTNPVAPPSDPSAKEGE